MPIDVVASNSSAAEAVVVVTAAAAAAAAAVVSSSLLIRCWRNNLDESVRELALSPLTGSNNQIN